MTISTNATVPLVVGCHHKTGTTLLSHMMATNLLGHLRRVRKSDLLARRETILGRPDERKLPLSKVIEELPAGFKCYLNIWFEHEIDVLPESVRFLHFVRHPVKWVRSAYLYHKAGGSTEGDRWLDWRIFSVGKQPLGYSEVLNALDIERGLAIESIRSYPEIAGTARSAATSSGLLSRLQVSLEKIEADFDGTVRSICDFIGVGGVPTRAVLDELRQHDVSRMSAAKMPPNVTRGTRVSAEIERLLSGDAEFHRLYAEPSAQMGFRLDGQDVFPSLKFEPEACTRVMEAKTELLRHPRSEEASDYLCGTPTGNCWRAYALQNFGRGGHLMMYEFIQEMIDALDPGAFSFRSAQKSTLLLV